MLQEPAARRKRHRHVVRPRVRDELSEKCHLDAYVVGDGGDRGGLERERDGRHRSIALRRADAIDRPVIRVGGRAAVAEHDQLAAAREPLPDLERSLSDRVGLIARHLLAQRRIVGHFHPDRCGDLGHGVGGRLPIAPEERIEKARFPDVMPQFAALEEDVHRLPQRVVEHLEDFLVDEGILGSRVDPVRAARPWQRKRHHIVRMTNPRGVQRILDQAVATRWAKPHDDVVGKQDGVEPALELDRQVERRQRALPDDHWVDELDRDVLRVGRVGAAPERQQPSALQEPVGHLPAGARESVGFAREERLAQPVARRQPVLDPRRQAAGCSHS